MALASYMESNGRVYGELFGINFCALRFSNVYGPWCASKSSVIAQFFRHALESNTITVFGDGSVERDFIFVDDLANSIMSCAEHQTKNSLLGANVFHICSEEATTINSVASKIQKLVKKEIGREIEIKYLPARIGDLQRVVSSNALVRKSTGWPPTTSLQNGILKTLKWFTDETR